MSEQKITQVEKTANEFGISVSKIEAVEEENVVITIPKKKTNTKASADSIINNTIGSSIEKEEPKKEELKKKKVALYSSRNVFWEGVGEVQRGYNFVTQEQADRWMTRIHIKFVTPEEIKEAFDN